MELKKVELYEAIRRDHFRLKKGIRQIARERHIHRREVRRAISNAIPPPRKPMERSPPVLTLALRQVVDGILEADRKAPRKQRHTARRIFGRLVKEHGFGGAESTVRKYVGTRRRELVEVSDAFVPQAHLPGHEGEVDWYEATVRFPWGESERSGVMYFRAVARICQRLRFRPPTRREDLSTIPRPERSN